LETIRDGKVDDYRDPRYNNANFLREQALDRLLQGSVASSSPAAGHADLKRLQVFAGVAI
jgi:hypothetical protein